MIITTTEFMAESITPEKMSIEHRNKRYTL